MDQSRIDLNLFLVFDAVAREGNVTRAGKRLGLSQPAVSAALARLRNLIGDPLFVRTRSGMVPTQRASTLMEPVDQALGLIRQTLQEQSDFDPRQSSRAFNIQMIDMGEVVFLPQIIQLLRDTESRVSVNTVQPAGNHAEQIAMFESGSINLALGYWPKFSARRGFYKERLFSESFACVARRNHPSIGRSLTLRQFVELPHLVIMTDGSSDGMVERSLSRSNVSRKIAARVPHFLAIPSILENSDLIATIPLGVAKVLAVRRRLKIMPAPLEMPHFEVSQYWHKRFHREPGLTWLRGIVQNFFASRHGLHDGKQAIGRRTGRGA